MGLNTCKMIFTEVAEPYNHLQKATYPLCKDIKLEKVLEIQD